MAITPPSQIRLLPMSSSSITFKGITDGYYSIIFDIVICNA